MKVTIENGFLGSYNLTIEGRHGLIKVTRLEIGWPSSGRDRFSGQAPAWIAAMQFAVHSLNMASNQNRFVV